MASIFFESLRTIHEKEIIYDIPVSAPGLFGVDSIEYQRGDVWSLYNNTDNTIDDYYWSALHNDRSIISQPIMYLGVRLPKLTGFIAPYWGSSFVALTTTQIQENAQYSCYPFMDAYRLEFDCSGVGNIILRILRSKQQGK